MAPSRPLEESDATMRKRLVESLSASFPGSALSKALHEMDSEDDNDSLSGVDKLSSSCFAELRLEKGPPDVELDEEDHEDDELTSLAWLQDTNLLKNIRVDSLCPSPTDDMKENAGIKQEPISYGQPHPPNIPYDPMKHINSKPPYSFSCLIFMAIENSHQKRLPVKDIYNWILSNFPFFQNAPTGWKNSVRHNLSLNKCFKKVDKEKGQSIGKGSLWCIDPDYRPNLLQALRKTPYHPYHQLQMLATPQQTVNYALLNGSRPQPLSAQRLNFNAPSPYLFPFLSKRLAQSNFEDVDDIDVANTLVSLKKAAQRSRGRSRKRDHGDRSRSPSPPEFGSERDREQLRKNLRSRHHTPIVITANPSDDHTYTLTTVPDYLLGSPGSSIDEEYDFGDANSDVASSDSEIEDSDFEDDQMTYDDSPPSAKKQRLAANEKKKSPPARMTVKLPGMERKSKRHLSAEDEDEEKKIVEGADALLNLAGIKTSSIIPLRSLSPTANNNNNNNLDTTNNNNTSSYAKGAVKHEVKTEC